MTLKHTPDAVAKGMAADLLTRPQVAAGQGARRAYQSNVGDRISRFLPMVRRQAWHVYGGGRQGIDVEDLFQAGLVALTECAQKHDEPTEDGFAAYAKMRVRGAMVDMIRREVPLSRGAGERRRVLNTAQVSLRTLLGRDPSTSELADALGMSTRDVIALSDNNRPVHFDSIDDAYSDQNIAFASSAPDSLTMLSNEQTRESVIAAITELPDRLKLVIQLYFVEELNLVEIAEVLQVSVPRVHQLKAQALAKLKADLDGVADVL